jgi:N6-adenosine-specific RNA methylase IME4/DNA-binding XRE family transcriptional regulator
MIKINDNFKNLIPELTPDEFEQLQKNCIKEGILESIKTWNGFIIDGHNRYEIATKHGLKYEIKEMQFESENHVIEWIILHQFGRRNLPNYERAKLALRLKDLFAEKAKENISKVVSESNQIRSNPTLQKSANLKIKKIDTREELAKIAGVSHDTIHKVETIENKATPEIKAKLQTQEYSINQAYKEIKKEEKIQQRTELIEKQKKEIAENKLPELSGLYDIISIDPPWNYGREYDPENSRVANPYPEMTIEEIKSLKLPFTENSIIFLWTTHKFLPDAFDILKNWGFEYKATLVWNKEKIGMGAWFRMQCEFCLFAIKGKPFWNNTTERDIIIESRREHSRKPDTFFEMVNKICVGRKLEYFAREKREGWDVFGNDLNKF